MASTTKRITGRRRTPTALALAGVLLAGAGCGAASSGAGVPAAAGRLPGQAAGSTTPRSAPGSTTPGSTAPGSTGPSARTATELRALLLTTADLPSVFSVDNTPSDGSSGISSPTSRCDALAGVLNDKTTGDASAEADIAFHGDTSTPYLSEDLAAMPSPASAAAYVNRLRDAVGSCDELRADVDGGVSLSVAASPAPPVGEQRFAMELTANSSVGEIALDVQLVTAGSIVLVTTGADATQVDMSAFTSDAYAKLTGATVPPGGHVKGESRNGGDGSGSGGSGGGSGGSGGSGSGGSRGGGQPA